MLSGTAATPPTGRDFEIHRLIRVEHVSTYRLAERFNISQTRVRQIVHRVDEWLASVLPAKSDAVREQETRLAQCLAADQLQSQIEKLQVFWDQTRDPKYLRQQTRAILALARLGVLPGAIDAAAAAAIEPDLAEHRGVGVSPARTDAAVCDVSDQQKPGRPEAYPTSPPAGDCSLLESFACEERADATISGSANDDPAAAYARDSAQRQEELAGLKLIENRLLTLLDGTPPADHQGRQGLEETLGNIRRQRRAYEIRLSPEAAGARMA